MTLQNKYRLLFVSRKHQRASTRFIAKAFTALVLVLLLFGVVGRLDAATVGVSSANVVSKELISFMAGGTTYTQADLIQPTLTAFSGAFARNIVVPLGGSLPAAGTRSLLLTHDFNLDSGIINSAVGATAAALQFSPPLINGPGPDLVVFELSDTASPPNDFLMQINGNTVTYLGTSYNTALLAGAQLQFQVFHRDAGTPVNISQLENDTYHFEKLFFEDVFGIAIDLDDFAVAPLGMVSTISYGSTGGGGQAFDPAIIMGINSIPEPSAITLAALGLLGVGWCRRKRV